MDINRPITNPDFKNAIQKIKQGAEAEMLFWKELGKAKLLCPVKVKLKATPQKGMGKIELKEETQISLLIINNEQGENFLMAFTDWEELEKWRKDKNQQTLILQYDDGSVK